MEAELIEPPRDIEPLTQKSTIGVLYKRAPKVEDQINWALTLSQVALVEFLEETQPDDPAYLKEETLVYLIRFYHKAHQRDMTEALWKVLYQRCIPMIRSKIPRYDERSGQAEQEVLVHLFGQIIHAEGEQGDFLQVRFWPGFRALVITVARALINDLEKDELLDPLSSLPGQELERAEDEPEEREPGAAVSDIGLPGEIPTERQVVINEALKQLPKPIRQAFTLHYFMGYPIESDKPDEKTVALLLGKSPKTIHNWLDKAEKILIQWRGETHEQSI